MSDRRRAHAFKAERQANFSKTVRKEYLDEGRRKRDAERARMEAYRVLCEKEGIQSKRLAEYDNLRAEASSKLSKALEEVDYDQSLTNNEKKRRKHNLKRKFSATSVNELLEKQEKKYNAITGAQEAQRKRQEERELSQKAREEREREKVRRLQARKSRNQLYTQRTNRGQPVLSSRMADLLERIQK